MTSASKIRQAFRNGDRTLIGISWRSINASTGFMRSMSLSDFLEPFKDMDVDIVNLQYGDCRAEIKEAHEKTGVAVKSVNEIDTFVNIDHLASLIQACNRVITIDNSTAHLSASMGIPTDILLPYVVDWRWCGEEHSSYWYDAVNLHRAPYGFSLKDSINDLVNQCFNS